MWEISELTSFNRYNLKNLPQKCGIYFVKIDDSILYIGKSINYKNRFYNSKNKKSKNECLGKRLAVDKDTQMIWRIIAAFDGEDISKVLYNYGMKVLEAKNIQLTDKPNDRRKNGNHKSKNK